jgi:hypothetical protein
VHALAHVQISSSVIFLLFVMLLVRLHIAAQAWQSNNSSGIAYAEQGVQDSSSSSHVAGPIVFANT